MKQTVGVITLPVADLKISRRFYCAGLGWAPVFDDGDVAFFQFNGFVLALWARSSFERDIGVASVGSGYKMALAHNVASCEDVDRVMAEAQSLGAKSSSRHRSSHGAATPRASPTRTTMSGKWLTTPPGRSLKKAT